MTSKSHIYKLAIGLSFKKYPINYLLNDMPDENKNKDYISSLSFSIVTNNNLLILI
jgi:hypothetical protein